MVLILGGKHSVFFDLLKPPRILLAEYPYSKGLYLPKTVSKSNQFGDPDPVFGPDTDKVPGCSLNLA